MAEKKCKINPKSTWEELTPGGTIYDAANSEEFETGDWRSRKPVFHEDKCKQCGLCCKGCGVCAKACPFGAITME